MANTGTSDGTLTAFDPDNTAEGRPQATPPTSISVAEFDQSYGGVPPWDIDGPQSAVVRVTEAGLVSGRVLDIGCGTGENALFLAAQGREVVGLDGCFSQHASVPGPRRLSEHDIRDTFARGWIVESITPARFDVVERDGFTSDPGRLLVGNRSSGVMRN